MRAWYMDPLGFHADLCLMLNGTSTRLTVRSPEGAAIHRDYYPTWDDALAALRYMLPRCVNELTGQPIFLPAPHLATRSVMDYNITNGGIYYEQA